MSARCVTHIFDDNGKDILCTMYRHSDGYPDGHGAELKLFLRKIRVVNGLTSYNNVANGMGCLAAQIVAHFKDGPGAIYIHPPGTEPGDIDFVYEVRSPWLREFQRPHEGDAVEVTWREYNSALTPNKSHP